MTWYSGDSPDRGTWWWAVEHRGHPAFYARSVMPGDFSAGRSPLPRHVMGLDGRRPTETRCGTCGEAPRGEDLRAVERATGDRLPDLSRSGRRPTDPRTCWNCCDPAAAADRTAEVGGVGAVAVCAPCAAAMVERS